MNMSKENFQQIREKSIVLAKKTIRESINEDNYVSQAINNIDELAKMTNVLTKRLRDWYSIYLPEFSKKVSDNEAFIKLAMTKDKKAIMTEMKLKESMGRDLSPRDLQPIKNLANKINSLYQEREELAKYLDEVMKTYCKNLWTLAGGLVGAKLLEEAGSLRKLVMMPSSKIQMLGAEKALFRHIKTGAKPPKHGYILMHPIVANAKKAIRGKAARSLADKICLAAKTDYFKGVFIGDKLKKELEEKFK